MPSASLESVKITRPLKVIAVLCMIISVVLAVLALCSSYWLRSGSFHTGLFKECTSEDLSRGLKLSIAPSPGRCRPNQNLNGAYVKVVMSLVIVGVIFGFLSLFLILCGMLSASFNRRAFLYRVSKVFALVSVAATAIGLLVLPICFYVKLNSRKWQDSEWEFDWSYGIAWGSVVFAFATLMLLLCDKDQQVVYYKEKILYNASGNGNSKQPVLEFQRTA